MVGFAVTILQGERHRWAVTNMQDTGAKNDGAAKGWPPPSAMPISAHIANIPRANLILTSLVIVRFPRLWYLARQRTHGGLPWILPALTVARLHETSGALC